MRLGNLLNNTKFRVLRDDGSLSPIRYVLVEKMDTYYVGAKRVGGSATRMFSADVEVLADEDRKISNAFRK
jgi:hypothetical protein